ncbi:kinase-like protein [Pholiota conissans]|uniref:mitogen-activated protein kinase kinase n=1 Tax=Pholiota conissans TaxID=109636 RepID=A0A9P5YTA1_9AGAR|nr:kinase-like protein [Pholiota conissans]
MATPLSWPKHVYKLTPGDIHYLQRTHPEVPLWRTSLLRELTPQADDSEIVASAQTTFGGIRLRAMRIHGGPHSITDLVKKLHRIPTKPHENLIQIRGLYAVDDEPLSLFSLDAPRITVMQYIFTHPHQDRRQMCADVARGLDHLHRVEIVHGAVRPANILVRPDGVCMLGEPSDEDIPHPGALTRLAPYLAPELFDPAAYAIFAIDNYRRDEYSGEYRVESDIYALGATTIEMYTSTPPAPFHIPFKTITTSKELFHLTRTPSTAEVEVIPHRIRAALSDIMHVLPYHRPHSGNALQWLERPDVMRVRACAPVNAKTRMRRAARAFWAA